MMENIIDKFRPEIWDTLSPTIKCVIIQNCVDKICEICDMPKIKTEIDKLDGAYAAYMPTVKKINIDLNTLNKKGCGYTVLTSLFHECRHYEQDIKKIYDLTIGFNDTKYYYLDICEYDAHMYEFEVASKQLIPFFNDKEFNDMFKKHYTGYFIGFADSLAKFGIINNFDKKEFKQNFKKAVFNNEKIYCTEDFKTAYHFFFNMDKTIELYNVFINAERSKLKKQFLPYIKEHKKYNMNAQSIKQSFKKDNYSIDFEQSFLQAKFSMTDSKTGVSLVLNINGMDARIDLMYSDYKNFNADTHILLDSAKAIIKQYGKINNFEVENIEEGKRYIVDPFREISDNLGLDASIILKNSCDEDYFNVQKELFTCLLQDYEQNENLYPLMQLNDKVKDVYKELIEEGDKFSGLEFIDLEKGEEYGH